MPKIIFRTCSGLVETNAVVGDTLLEVARKNNISLFAGCNGASACGTCQVYIVPDFLPKLKEPSTQESELLEVIAASKSNSRLACQIVITEELDGMMVTIP
ncbi:MAG: 2Fe-2S iron-sulfur cluster binding domain-containing protein [Holosporales bacterium]|nr:2Fe-2S iron-sulfur cluster binding domain-containing protein [Holosporales bacterium]